MTQVTPTTPVKLMTEKMRRGEEEEEKGQENKRKREVKRGVKYGK